MLAVQGTPDAPPVPEEGKLHLPLRAQGPLEGRIHGCCGRSWVVIMSS